MYTLSAGLAFRISVTESAACIWLGVMLAWLNANNTGVKLFAIASASCGFEGLPLTGPAPCQFPPEDVPFPPFPPLPATALLVVVFDWVCVGGLLDAITLSFAGFGGSGTT